MHTNVGGATGRLGALEARPLVRVPLLASAPQRLIKYQLSPKVFSLLESMQIGCMS